MYTSRLPVGAGVTPGAGAGSPHYRGPVKMARSLDPRMPREEQVVMRTM